VDEEVSVAARVSLESIGSSLLKAWASRGGLLKERRLEARGGAVICSAPVIFRWKLGDSSDAVNEGKQ